MTSVWWVHLFSQSWYRYSIEKSPTKIGKSWTWSAGFNLLKLEREGLDLIKWFILCSWSQSWKTWQVERRSQSCVLTMSHCVPSVQWIYFQGADLWWDLPCWDNILSSGQIYVDEANIVSILYALGRMMLVAYELCKPFLVEWFSSPTSMLCLFDMWLQGLIYSCPSRWFTP